MATTLTAKIQSYEVQPNGIMRISTLFRLFQKVAGDDLDKIGLTYDYLKEKGIVFVLTKMSVKFFSNIKTYDHIEITTYPRKSHGVSFIRDFDVKIDGVRVAYASSTWAIIDVNSRRLLRPSAMDEIGSIPCDNDDYMEMDNYRIKLSADELSRTDVRRVYYSQIDCNCHMNNTFYPDIVYDYLPDEYKEDYTGKTISVCYITEIMCGEKYEVYTKLSDNKFEVLATNPETGKDIFTSIIDF